MKRFLWIVLWIATITTVSSAQTTFYYPHVANGVLGGTVWKTTVFLTNPSGSTTASGTITFTQENPSLGLAGTPFTISFTDENGAPAGSGNVITFTIPPGATRKYVSSGTGTFGGGFAVVAASQGTVAGTAIFSEFDLAGHLIGEAGVPASPAVPNQAIFVDTIGGFNVGVAYANPGSAAASVTLSLLDSAAATVATTTQQLGQGNHTAAFVSQLFPSAGQLAGTMQLRSDAPLAAIALRFDATSPIFTTLPPVTLASLINPAMEWFSRRPWAQPFTSIARLLGAFQVRLV
jgi:hypothetical protein